MCTKEELMTFLKTLPDGTEIQIIEEYTHSYETCTRWKDLDVVDLYSPTWEYSPATQTLYLGER